MATHDALRTESEVWSLMNGAADRCAVLNSRVGGGVPLGATRTGNPVSMQLLRPAPVRVVVVDQAWIASLLAVRATVFGARTFFVTERPAPWVMLVRAFGGTQPFATVVPADGLSLPPASAAEPLCVVVDGAITGPDTGIARGPWHTSLHLLHRLGSASSSLIDTADLVLVPQPPAHEVEATIETLRLPPAIDSRIARMQTGEVLAVTRTRALFTTIQATSAEMGVLQSQ